MPTSRVWLEHSEQNMLVHLLHNFLKDMIPIEDQLAWLFGKFHKTRAQLMWAFPEQQFDPVFLLTLRKNLTNSNFNRVNEYLDKDFDYDFDDDYVEIDRNMKLIEI